MLGVVITLVGEPTKENSIQLIVVVLNVLVNEELEVEILTA